MVGLERIVPFSRTALFIPWSLSLPKVERESSRVCATVGYLTDDMDDAVSNGSEEAFENRGPMRVPFPAYGGGNIWRGTGTSLP